MLRLVAWLVCVWGLWRLWGGERRRPASVSRPARSDARSPGSPAIDRSWVVDADFTDIEPGSEGAQ